MDVEALCEKLGMFPGFREYLLMIVSIVHNPFTVSSARCRWADRETHWMNELLWYFCTQGIGTNEDRKQLRQEIVHTLKIIKEVRGKTEMEFIFRVPFGCFTTLAKSRESGTTVEKEMEELWSSGYFAERVSQTTDFLEINFPVQMEQLDRSRRNEGSFSNMAHELLERRGTFLSSSSDGGGHENASSQYRTG